MRVVDRYKNTEIRDENPKIESVPKRKARTIRLGPMIKSTIEKNFPKMGWRGNHNAHIKNILYITENNSDKINFIPGRILFTFC